MPKRSVRIYFQASTVEVLDGFPITLTYDDFEDYQRWMSSLMEENERVLVGAFMGSGKTGSSLYATKRIQAKGLVQKTLVVAPLNVAKDTWPDEMMIWDFAREMSFSVIVGTAEERAEAVEKDADIYFINRENLRWLYEHVGMRGWKWDHLIYDEATRLSEANKKTKGNVRKDGVASRKRLSEFGYLTKVRHKFKVVWELSGTPCPRGLIGLWGPVYILDKGERLGTSITAYRQRWFQYSGYTHKYTPFEHSEAEITERLKDVMFVLREEDYLDLPPLIERDRWVNLSPKHMQQYRLFERELALEEYNVDAANNAVLANKLLQFANGSVYAEEDGDPLKPPEEWERKSVAKHIHNRKLEELGSVFQEAEGRSVLIAYSYRFDVHAIKKRYPWVRIYGETPNDLQDWNKGRLRAMVLHPASAGHGMNFQRGGNIAVWYGLNWSLELYQQFNKRLHRRGQEEDKVFLHRILARGTADETVAARLVQNAETQDRITENFRVRMEHVQEWARAA